MGHTHLNLEVELGYSHLLSTMEIASSTDEYTLLRAVVDIRFDHMGLSINP